MNPERGDVIFAVRFCGVFFHYGIYIGGGLVIHYNTDSSQTPSHNAIIKTSFDNDYVSIDVTDTGIEIDKNDYEKIFTKFSRIDNPLTRKVQGSGLGLYITKNLVEKMNGKISVSSENGQTTFSVKFQCANVERQAKNAVGYTHN